MAGVDRNEPRALGDIYKKDGDQGGDVPKKQCTRPNVFETFPGILKRRLKAVIRLFLDSSFAGPNLDPNLPSLAALKIHSCNASGKSVPFCRATCNVERQASIFPLFVVFKAGFEILKEYLISGSAPVEHNRRHILAKLLNFMMDIENESPLHGLENCGDETSLTVLLANHLFAKLSSSSQFIMDNHYAGKSDRCPCSRDQCELTGKFGDTSIGNTNVWHGSLDAILNCNLPDCNLPVKFATHSVGDSEEADDETGRKSSDVGKSHVGVENKAVGLKLNQQIIAEVIVFSFLNKKLQPYSSHFLLPCIGASDTDLVVYFHDSQHDVLLESC